MRNINWLAIVVALWALCSNAAIAQSSKDYAMMGYMAWSAFECSSLASVAGDTKEQERLFRFGYEQGKQFIDALLAKKISQSDLSSSVPSGFLMLAQGPTADFILGRVFESAQDNALKNIFVNDGKLNPKDLQKVIAENRQHERNCRLIGQTK